MLKSSIRILTEMITFFGVVLALGMTADAASPVYVDDNCSPPSSGTSIDPYCTIQEGVEAVSPGGYVFVAAGSYPEVVNVNKSITLQGPLSGSPADVDGFELNANKIGLSYFLITPDEDNPGITTSADYSGYNINRNEISGGSIGILYATNGIYPNAISRNTIHDNNGGEETEGPVGFGILGNGPVSNTVIDRNNFSNLDNNSVRSLSASTKLTIEYNNSISVRTPYHIGSVNNLIIRNNTSSAFAPGGSGIYLSGNNNGVTIAYNTITGPGTYHGIDVDRPDGVNYNVTITRNTITAMGGYGILVNPNSLSPGSSLTYNIIESNGAGPPSAGIFVENGNSGLKLSNNRLRNNVSFDLIDATQGGGTAGTANTYTYNYCNTSLPAGLCYAPNP
jgi:hypothetical protein